MIRIGVLGTSGIAERRMIPAIRKETSFQYAGVAFSTREEMGFEGTEADFAPLLVQKQEKAERIRNRFGGRSYTGYEMLLADPDIDAVYIALPPAMHAVWIRAALLRGKHVLAEKPFTTREEDTREMVELANRWDLALIENYGFGLHAQMGLIRQWMEDGMIGEMRMVRAAFGFPHRDNDDFRYKLALGGGALLDCGGYTLKAGTLMLGMETEVVTASSTVTDGHEVDVFGSATLRRPDGLCAQLAWGMDQSYRCELEIWGSRGMITAPRIFTAPDGFPAPVILKTGTETVEKKAADDQFQRILERFAHCVREENTRRCVMDEILRQASLTGEVRSRGMGWKP